MRTVMEAAKAKGKRIGWVTTATLYDATPAAFSVHAKSRNDFEVLVNQYLALEPDVLMGGGADYFLPVGVPGGKRRDGKDVIAAFRELILKQPPYGRNYKYGVQNALGRMVARQSGLNWGTWAHTSEPVLIGAMGPGAGLFRGYQDNTEFGKHLHRLINGR